jgi:hypothetical protein
VLANVFLPFGTRTPSFFRTGVFTDSSDTVRRCRAIDR